MIRFLIVPAAAVCLTAATLTGTFQNKQDVVEVLRPYVRATEGELRRLEHGSVLTKTLDTPDGKEVTTFGAIRVACTADVFAARIREIEKFKASEYVLQIGRFQAQPSAADLAGLTLEPGDREAMRTCKAGACGLRLPLAAMDKFRTSIPWGTPAEVDAAAAAMRQFLADEARTYLVGGSAALPDYADRAGTTPRAAASRPARLATAANPSRPESTRSLVRSSATLNCIQPWVPSRLVE